MRESAPVSDRVAGSWRLDPVVARATEKLLTLHADASRKQCDAIVRIGRVLRDVHERLPHGQWLAWIEEALPFSRPTIANYVGLAEFAAREPAEYARLRDLGPTKLYQLANLRPDRRRRFRVDAPLSIPGAVERKTLKVMTADELRRVIVGDVLAIRPPQGPPIAEVIQTFRRRLTGVAEIAQQLGQRRAEVDRRHARTLHAELLAVIHAVEAAFDL
jgi:hypothetical protein